MQNQLANQGKVSIWLYVAMIGILRCWMRDFMGMKKIETETEIVIVIVKQVTLIFIFVIFLIEMQLHLSLF